MGAATAVMLLLVFTHMTNTNSLWHEEKKNSNETAIKLFCVQAHSLNLSLMKGPLQIAQTQNTVGIRRANILDLDMFFSQ